MEVNDNIILENRFLGLPIPDSIVTLNGTCMYQLLFIISYAMTVSF
jgi:hypothetical protein